MDKNNTLEKEFLDPPKEFSVMPFWFWNDDLEEAEIIRQIADFEHHGVYGFVIHPRIGLPKGTGWMSDKMIAFMKVAVAEARKRGMYVVLYDDGMYPSGSSSGQVVKENPAFAERMLDKIDIPIGEEPELQPDWNLVKVIERPSGKRTAVIDRPSGGTMRGLHFLDENPANVIEERPPLADLLNPEAVNCFIRHVYDRYYKELGQYFGNTVFAIFTDEPHLSNGTTGILKEVNRILGYDFTPYLADLWYDDHENSKQHRAEYKRAISIRAEETYYAPLSKWCESHGIALTGHPSSSMDIGMERYFHIPGQDLVWRYVAPGKTALEGEHSTMAKCASSAMIHLDRRRNSNELYGAYGHELTFEEVKWLANWCFVRGQNLLYPHAFYYSVRGPRRDERPPDVGPNSAWWHCYKPYADACRRLSWLNTDSKHICEIAILCDAQWLPDISAKICFQSQRDFNYIELRSLCKAKIDSEGIHMAGMNYKTVILEKALRVGKDFSSDIGKLADAGRLIIWGDRPEEGNVFPNARLAEDEAKLLSSLDELVKPDLELQPRNKAIRHRHVVKDGINFHMLFNEELKTVSTKLCLDSDGKWEWWNPYTGGITVTASDNPVSFAPGEMKILCVKATSENSFSSGCLKLSERDGLPCTTNCNLSKEKLDMANNDNNSLALSAKNEIDHLNNSLTTVGNLLEVSKTSRLIRICKRHFDLFIRPISRFYECKDLELIHKYISKWNWHHLSANPSLPWSDEFIGIHRSEWSWKSLSGNTALPWTMELIDKYNDKWSWDYLSENPSLPWSGEFIGRYESKWNWDVISENPDLPWTIELIENYKDKWSWDYLGANPSLPWSDEFIGKYIGKWDWGYLSKNPALPWNVQLLLKYEDKWDWGSLSQNTALPWNVELLLKYEDKWDWGSLSQNTALPWNVELLLKYKSKWDWGSLSRNTAVPWNVELLLKYKNKWDWEFLSGNPALPWDLELLEKYKYKWDWGYLSKNPALPWSVELLGKYKNKWNWDYLSKNPALPWGEELLEKYKNKWNWNFACSNPNFPWTIELIEKYKYELDWYKLMTNEKVPWSLDLIEKHENELKCEYDITYMSKFASPYKKLIGFKISSMDEAANIFKYLIPLLNDNIIKSILEPVQNPQN